MSENLKYRLGGLVGVIAAVGLGWWLIWLPLLAARAHAPRVEVYLKSFVLVPMLAIFGLFFLFGGNRWPYRNAEKKQLTPVGWALMIMVAVAAFGSYFWLKGVFAALGYD